jgi:O-antigen/teichoic acid export membrane protein
VTTEDVLDTPQAGPAAIRGGALRATAHAGGILLALISAPLLIRHLGVADFGKYVLIGSIVATVGGVLDGGLVSIAQREYVTQSGEERDRSMRALLGLRLLLMGTAALVAVGFAALAGYDETIVLGVVIAASAMVIISAQHLLLTPLVAALRYGTTTALDVLGQVLIVSSMVVLVVADAPLLAFVAIGLPLNVLMLTITSRLVRGTVPGRPAFERERWWALVKDTLPYAAAAAISAIYLRLALIVLSLVSDDLETGYYATSYRVLEVVLAVPSLLVSAAFPVLARAATEEDESRLAYQVTRMFEVAVLLGLWFLLALEMGAPVIIDVLAGDQGEPAVEVLRLQAPVIVFTFLAIAAAFVLLSMRRHKEVLIANAAALAGSVVATAVLAPSMGANGAAIATVVAEALLGITMTVQVVRARASLGFPAARVPPLLLVAGVAACTILLPVPAIAHLAIATAVYFGLLFALGRIPEEIFQAFALRRGAAARRTS